MEEAAGIMEELLVVGDFNIHVDCPSCPRARSFLSLLEFHGLVQLVTERTHERSHTLDLFILRAGNIYYTTAGNQPYQ